MKKTVVAIYNSMEEAKDASDQLVNSGFNRNDIDVSSGGGFTASNNGENENGITRFFKNLFGNNESEQYTKAAERGYVVTVHANSDEEAQRASALLDDSGAIDVDNNGAIGTDSNYKQSANADYSGVRSEESNDLNKTIPVIEENIKVGKKEVATGGVRIRSRIIEKPVEENLRLREERIHVERNKVDRPATDAELNAFKNETIEATEHTEIPVVQKDSRVVEEISLEKTVHHRDETIQDRLKKTEVDVEDIYPDRQDREVESSQE